MTRAVLCLGTNIGDRMGNLKAAGDALALLIKTELIKASAVYETEPFGVPDKQDNFYNCCILLKTDLPPEILMGACLGIEAKMGRLRPYKNSPRVIDIDIIAMENVARRDELLTLPHPRFSERAFVIRPLLDIFPDGKMFGTDFGKSLCSLNVTGIKSVGAL